MNISMQKATLESLRDRIRAKDTGDINKFIESELMPLINDSPELREAFKWRASFYERLLDDAEYHSLIKHIHELMEKLHGKIDPKKLPEESIDIFHHPVREKDGSINPNLTTCTDLHSYLGTKDDPWYQLGQRRWDTHVSPQEDSLVCPWKSILKQYEKVEALIQVARKHGALKRGTKTIEADLKRSISKLRVMLERPWIRYHIPCFEFVERNARIMERQPDMTEDDEWAAAFEKSFQGSNNIFREQYISRAYSYAETVCSDLLITLEETEASPLNQNTEDLISGVSVDVQKQKVSYQGHTEKYGIKSQRWTVFRLCKTEEPDGIGKVSTECFAGKTDADLNQLLSKINKPWKENTGYRLLSLKDGYIHLDPKKATKEQL